MTDCDCDMTDGRQSLVRQADRLLEQLSISRLKGLRKQG